MEEIWKDIKDYKGLYQVSNLGRVKSFHWKKEKILIASIGHLYFKVLLVKDKLRKNKNIHRLVAEAFIPNPENKREVNHKDGNKLNNRIDNLEWMTRLENMRHASDTGLAFVGKKNSSAKLTEKEVVDIYTRALKGERGVDIHKDYSFLHKETIWAILRGEKWTHITKDLG